MMIVVVVAAVVVMTMIVVAILAQGVLVFVSACQPHLQVLGGLLLSLMPRFPFASPLRVRKL